MLGAVSYGNTVIVKITRHRWMAATAACLAIAIILFWQLHLSKSPAEKGALSANENEVYEAVVRDMLAPCAWAIQYQTIGLWRHGADDANA
jgi:hypothetical protein